MNEDAEVLVKAFEIYGKQSLEKNKEKIQKLHQGVLESIRQHASMEI